MDTRYLETLLGYNARRAALTLMSVFMERMARYELRAVDFAVLTILAHSPGVSSRQICAALDVLPPNLATLLKALEGRGLLERRPHPKDGRSMGLHLSRAGKRLQRNAQATASRLERDMAATLTLEEQSTLNRLLRRIYKT